MSAKNRETRGGLGAKSLFPSALDLISSASTFDQGDLLCLDTSTHRIRRYSAETDGEFACGISRATIVSGVMKSAYTTDVDASAGISDIPGPVYGLVAKLVLKTGDSINPGDLVYWDADQRVAASGTKAIGIMQGKAVSSAAAGTQIEVLLGARSPEDTLQF